MKCGRHRLRCSCQSHASVDAGVEADQQTAASGLPFDMQPGDEAPAELQCLASPSLLPYPGGASEAATPSPISLVGSQPLLRRVTSFASGTQLSAESELHTELLLSPPSRESKERKQSFRWDSSLRAISSKLPAGVVLGSNWASSLL